MQNGWKLIGDACNAAVAFSLK